MRTAADLGSTRENLLHATLGLMDEVGEVAKTMKSHIAYGRELDINNLVEEVGDVMWFVALLCHTLGVPMSYVAVDNIAKLRRRYPEKFTEFDALARKDKEQS
jgi:NTP pyrophosphatase (non-canonical NTP hydrolase)